MQIERITLNPAVMGGKPCIRGMGVTVGMIVRQISTGRSIEDRLIDHATSSVKTSCRRCATPDSVAGQIPAETLIP